MNPATCATAVETTAELNFVRQQGFKDATPASLGALILGRFCLGSYLFLLFTGQGAFANRTLPWSRTEGC
jgi:hypothetical protein